MMTKKQKTPLLILLLSVIIQFSYAQSKDFKKIEVYTTAENTKNRLTKTQTVLFSDKEKSETNNVTITINPEKTDQTILGIGGAVTDASAEIFAKLPKAKQKEFLEAYYSKDKGIGYSLARTTIHSSDFSSESYTYITEGDKDLKTFSIAHDREYRIPLLKKILHTANNKVVVYASPWSPPAFMKSNNNMLHGGTLLPDFAQSWANYYAKFINEYQKEGINIWGVTVQNEPMASQTWESCIYTPEAERDFLRDYLGPTFEKQGLKDKKIIIWDHNRGEMLETRAKLVFDDPAVSKYAWEIGFHWYETWAGGPPKFESVGAVHQLFPNKNLLFTEGCVERFDASKYQFWANGERYGLNMINDFNNGAVGRTDWNILLDQNGGPNHVGNFCFAPIHADTNSGELIYTPSYYYIGHFSKFIRPEAKRVSSTVSKNNLLSTSFLNKDGKMVTIVMNQNDTEVIYTLCVGTQISEITIFPHAIQTLIY